VAQLIGTGVNPKNPPETVGQEPSQVTGQGAVLFESEGREKRVPGDANRNVKPFAVQRTSVAVVPTSSKRPRTQTYQGPGRKSVVRKKSRTILHAKPAVSIRRELCTHRAWVGRPFTPKRRKETSGQAQEKKTKQPFTGRNTKRRRRGKRERWLRRRKVEGASRSCQKPRGVKTPPHQPAHGP